jgi:SMODS and SLOG-associating 2TM effector domain 1
VIEHPQEVLDLYKAHRVKDQVDDFYTKRSTEYRSAYRQSVFAKGVLFALGAIAALLAALNVVGHRALLSVAAAGFPALSTALVAYDGLISFDRLAKLYSHVVGAVGRVAQPTADDPQAVSDYVAEVESIFLREQSEWAQVTREIEQQAPPSPQ